MITAESKYLGNLDVLQNVNQPSYVLLPNADKIYNIDVNTRKIDNPNITLVEKDHRSSTIYFCVDRFIDYMDLAHTKCIVQYNIGNKTHYYPVPFYDVYTKAIDGKIVFPWNVDYSVTKAPGVVTFAIRFFKVGEYLDKDNNPQLALTYNLNILPTTLTITKALIEQQFDEKKEAYLEPGEVEKIMVYVDKTMQTLSRKVYWTVLNDDFTDTTIDVSGEIKERLLDTF